MPGQKAHHMSRSSVRVVREGFVNKGTTTRISRHGWTAMKVTLVYVVLSYNSSFLRSCSGRVHVCFPTSTANSGMSRLKDLYKNTPPSKVSEFIDNSLFDHVQLPASYEHNGVWYHDITKLSVERTTSGHVTGTSGRVRRPLTSNMRLL